MSFINTNDSSTNLRHLPLTRRAEWILKIAYAEASDDNKNVANQYHLLLALLKENDGLTKGIFKSFSIDYEIIKILEDPNAIKSTIEFTSAIEDSLSHYINKVISISNTNNISIDDDALDIGPLLNEDFLINIHNMVNNWFDCYFEYRRIFYLQIPLI